jgi:polysaccharide pyruvyl transferase CsaB
VFNLLAVLKAVYRADLLLSGGGSLLQTATSQRSFYYYLGVLLLGKLLGKPVMLYAQGIGPVHGKIARMLMRLIVEKTDLIAVRDEGSFYELRESGVRRPQIKTTADAVLGMRRVALDKGNDVLKNSGVERTRPIIGIAPRRWGKNHHYFKALAEAADLLVDQKQAQVVFIPMHMPDDLRNCRDIAAMMRNPAIVLEGGYDAGMFMSIVGNMELLIGVRLHALIFAAIMGTPIIAVSYDPKIDRFMESIGLEAVSSLDTASGGAVFKAAAAIMTERELACRHLAEKMSALQAKALSTADMAIELLRSAK